MLPSAFCCFGYSASASAAHGRQALALPKTRPVAVQPSSYVSGPPPLAELQRVHRIGSGSGGTFWMVRHAPTGQHYALKVLYGRHHDRAARRRIAREVSIVRAADHPEVVRCHGMYAERGGEVQVLLEYMDGGSLEGNRITAEPLLAGVVRQVLSGIAYLHRRRIVHPDVQPSNFLVDSAGRVKIADRGVGRYLDDADMNPCDSSLAVVAYMSPERIDVDSHDAPYDGYAGNIWSFGLSVLELYLGRFPFGEDLRRQRDRIALTMCTICFSDPPKPPATASQEFRDFISCCLQKNPAKRLTAEQLLLHPFLTGPQQTTTHLAIPD